MSNNTGIVYGLVTSQDDGSPLPGVAVDLNWVQDAQGGPMSVGGNDGLTSWVPRVKTTSAGEYLIPFFWASEQVPGDIASALAVRFYDDNSYTSMNRHGPLTVSLDVRRLLGIVTPPLPTSGAAGFSMALKFWLAATPELKGMSMLTRFIGSLKLSAIENQGIVCRIDFQLPYMVGSF
ncbi:hypothetical protein P0D75_06680 [Paraburkholderia sediminicola]|uniref:hypothetical protein n=1 Tax=Paraburkholderia sediminicola TaxID=458836 RepID=UPI0038B853A1